jgi:putative acetyltransferase
VNTTPATKTRLRAGRGADAPRIWDVRTRAIRHGCRGHYPARLLERWAAAPMPPGFAAHIGRQCYIVAEAPGSIVGFAAFRRTTREVNAVFVAPEAMGTGLGARMLRQLEAQARRMGVGRVWLKASLNAVPFYQAAGWTAGKRSAHHSRTGITIDCVYMDKRFTTRARPSPLTPLPKGEGTKASAKRSPRSRSRR